MSFRVPKPKTKIENLMPMHFGFCNFVWFLCRTHSQYRKITIFINFFKRFLSILLQFAFKSTQLAAVEIGKVSVFRQKKLFRSRSNTSVHPCQIHVQKTHWLTKLLIHILIHAFHNCQMTS